MSLGGSSSHRMDRGAGCASRCIIPRKVPQLGRGACSSLTPSPPSPPSSLWFFGWGSQLFGNSDLCRHRPRGHRHSPAVTRLHPTPPSQFPPQAQNGTQTWDRFRHSSCCGIPRQSSSAGRRLREPGSSYRRVSPGQPQSWEPENPGFTGRPNLRDSCQQCCCRR